MRDDPAEPGQTGTNADTTAPADDPAATTSGETTGETSGTGAGDEPAERHPFRRFFARHRTLDLTYRVVVAVIGTAVVVGGVILIPLPGPGWLIVFAGLAILATEFAWAERLLRFARRKVHGWTDWVREQPLAVRMLIGLVGLTFLAATLAVYVRVYGVPGWVPLL